MIIYHDEKLQRLYDHWCKHWSVWYDSRTKANNHRARRYEARFKRLVTTKALQEQLSLDSEQLAWFSFRLDDGYMRIYHRNRFVGMAYIVPNIEDTGTTKIVLNLDNEVSNEY